MYINPDRLDFGFQERLVRWFEANGCRDWVALEPIIIVGSWIHYTSYGRRFTHGTTEINQDRTVLNRDGTDLVARRRKLRIRIPLKDVE